MPIQSLKAYSSQLQSSQVLLSRRQKDPRRKKRSRVTALAFVVIQYSVLTELEPADTEEKKGGGKPRRPKVLSPKDDVYNTRECLK